MEVHSTAPIRQSGNNRRFMPDYTGKDISMEYDDCSRLLYMTTDIQYG
jgi:hypothetical protein